MFDFPITLFWRYALSRSILYSLSLIRSLCFTDWDSISIYNHTLNIDQNFFFISTKFAWNAPRSNVRQWTKNPFCVFLLFLLTRTLIRWRFISRAKLYVYWNIYLYVYMYMIGAEKSNLKFTVCCLLLIMWFFFRVSYARYSLSRASILSFFYHIFFSSFSTSFTRAPNFCSRIFFFSSIECTHWRCCQYRRR